MDECVYFTRRTFDNNGKVIAWANRKECPKCHEAKMGKPVTKGKVSIRAKEYVCPKCGHREEQTEYEESLTVELIYTCPFCGNQGDTTTQYKRKKWEGVDAYIFTCQKCNKKIGITKKMKSAKVKKGKGADKSNDSDN